MVRIFTILYSCFLFINYGFCQTSSLDDIQLLDNYRAYQILNDSSIKNSFLIRSTSNYHYIKNIKKSSLNILYNNLNNNNLPIANNLSSIIPSRGLQERISLSTYIRFKNLEFNLNPEFLYVENKDQIKFIGNTEDGNWWARYYLMVANNVSDFRQFGNDKISKTFAGQSRIGFNNKIISFGISNQNVWWGPGIRNSLIFSNNANGFKHLYFSTSKPLKSKFGDLEFYILKGDIDSTIYFNEDDKIMGTIWRDGIINKFDKGRNIYAFNFVWNPNFAKNLYLGYSIANQFYKNKFSKSGIKYSNFSKDKPQMTLKSLQIRYLLPKDNSEIYLEIGNQNNTYIFSDTSNIGFIVGARKFFKVTKKINYELFLECTQLSLMNPKMIFNNGDPFGQPRINSWYTSSQIRQGWTNQGKLIGSFIGPGSNSQIVGMNFYKKINKIGIFAERTLYNSDFYHYVYLGRLGYSTADAYYVDLSWGINTFIKLNSNLMIASSFISTQSLNYRWVKNGNWQAYAEPGFNSDRSNIQFFLSLRYNINDPN